MEKKTVMDLISFAANGVHEIHVTKEFPKTAEDYLYSHFEDADDEVKAHIMEIMYRTLEIVKG